MGDYEDFVKKYGKGAAPAATATAAPAAGSGDYAAFMAKYGKSGNPELDRARNRPSAPQGAGPFGRVSAPEVPAPTSDAVLENMKKPGQAYQQLLAHPRDPGSALNVLINSEPDAQVDANRSRILNAIHPGLGNNPSGLAKAGTDLFFDPTTYLGGSGLTEKLANAAGRTGYIAAAKGMAHANPVSKVAAGIHDFVTPGGAEMGQLKRTFAANEGRAGLDKYVQVRGALKGAANTGADPQAAVAEALGIKPTTTMREVPPVKAPPVKKVKPQQDNFNPAAMGVPSFTKPVVVPPRTAGQDLGAMGLGPGYLKHAPPVPPAPKMEPVEVPPQLPQEILDAIKPRQSFTGGGRYGEVARGISKGAKTLTKGATDLMFVAPQLPGMEGHGSNVLQTALLSDPLTTTGALGRFAASGEAIPHSGVRNFVQNLPGVRGLKNAQDASVARATASGATTAHNPDFGDGGWLSKIPGVGMAARESNRGLASWDAAVKGSLNDKFTKDFLAQGYTPKVAAAKAADRVAQDVVDYSDKSDFTRTLSHGLPFSTYATKKPGIIARAAIRHPERVLAMTRDNPNFDKDRDEPMTGFDQGRPFSSIFNAGNNRSPQSKGGAPYPGAQYQRASQGAFANDLLGLANPYFTSGPPAKHADGDAALGWLKLLLSQTVGSAPFVGDNPIPGHKDDTLLSRLGLNYYGGQ